MTQGRVVSRYEDEFIYKLISKPEQDKSRPSLYRSKASHALFFLSRSSSRTINRWYFVQHNGKMEAKEFSFGSRDHRPFATMGLAKGVITSKPEDFLHKHTGYANMSRGQ
jgi:hypothetical protein